LMVNGAVGRPGAIVLPVVKEECLGAGATFHRRPTTVASEQLVPTGNTRVATRMLHVMMQIASSESGKTGVVVPHRAMASKGVRDTFKSLDMEQELTATVL